MKQKSDKRRCIFCEAVVANADEENLVVFRGRLSFIILNRYPYTSGHLMIAPYEHVSKLTGTTQETAQEIMQFSRRAEEILEDVYQPDGLNLGMNLGEAAGAGIEQHIHMHVLPRWKGDANFMTSIGQVRIIPESLQDTFARLHGKFAEP